MKLNRRYKHNLKHNLSFYLATVILTAVSIFLFLSILTTGTGLDGYVTDFAQRHNMEDAQFSTLMPIEKADRKDLEKKYDLTLEQTGYVDVEEKDYTVRVLKRNQKIDTYEVFEGKDVVDDDEIMLSKGFAQANDLAIGDKLKLDGKQYTITGFLLRPDYINCLENLTDAYRNNEGFAVAAVSDDTYDKLEDETVYYTVVYHDSAKEKQFRKKVNQDYTMLQYTDASVNPRIEAVQNNPKTYMMMSYMMMCLMMVIVSILVAAILSRKVKSECKIIGTLKALGYRTGELTRHYATMALIASIAGTVIGLIMAALGAQSMAEYYAVDYEPMPIHYTVPLYGAAICIVLPTLFYVVSAILTTKKLLRRNAVDLLNASTSKKGGSKAFASNRTMKFKWKFRLRTLLSNKARALVVLIGLVVGGYIMAMGLTFFDSCDNFVNNSVNSIGSFSYRYYLTSYETKEQGKGCETYINESLQPKDIENSQFSLSGLQKDSKYITLTDLDGKKVTLKDGDYYLTEMAAKVYGLSAGDKFTFYSPITMDEYTVKITGIVEDCAQKTLYTTGKTVRELMELDDDVYNVILSDHKLKLKDSEVAVTNTKESVQDQIQSVIDDLQQIIIVMILLGAVLCVAAVYLTVNMMVEENGNTISMLKIFGYRKGEINSMVLSANHILVPLSLVISIPLGILAGDLFYTMMIDNLSAYIEAVISVKSSVLCAALVVVSYLLSLTLLKRKVFRVNMVECLKDNRA